MVKSQICCQVTSVGLLYVCVLLCLNCVLILLASIEEILEEINSKTKAYLSLLELGMVLEEIRDACPCE